MTWSEESNLCVWAPCADGKNKSFDDDMTEISVLRRLAHSSRSLKRNLIIQYDYIPFVTE